MLCLLEAHILELLSCYAPNTVACAFRAAARLCKAAVENAGASVSDALVGMNSSSYGPTYRRLLLIQCLRTNGIPIDKHGNTAACIVAVQKARRRRRYIARTPRLLSCSVCWRLTPDADPINQSTCVECTVCYFCSVCRVAWRAGLGADRSRCFACVTRGRFTSPATFRFAGGGLSCRLSAPN